MEFQKSLMGPSFRLLCYVSSNDDTVRMDYLCCPVNIGFHSDHRDWKHYSGRIGLNSGFRDTCHSVRKYGDC